MIFEALSGIEVNGHSFPIVRVRRALFDGGFDSVPWPAYAVFTE